MTALGRHLILGLLMLTASCSDRSATAPGNGEPVGSEIAAFSSLSVTINGDFDVAENETCTWTSTVTGGQPPYTYEWFRDVVPVGSSDAYTAGTGTQSFQLALRVTDAALSAKTDRRSVTVHSNWPFVCS